MKIKPLADWVCLEGITADKVVGGGVFIPDALTGVAKVLAVGPGRRDQDGKIIPMTLEVDDLVGFNTAYPAPGVQEAKEVFLFYREHELMCVVEVEDGEFIIKTDIRVDEEPKPTNNVKIIKRV